MLLGSELSLLARCQKEKIRELAMLEVVMDIAVSICVFPTHHILPMICIDIHVMIAVHPRY